MSSHEAIPSSLFAPMKRKSDSDEFLSPKKRKKQPKLVFSADLWARVVEYLPYSNVLPLSLTTPFFTKEVFPLFKTLFIDNEEQTIGVHARRFQSAESIFLLCFPRLWVGEFVSRHTAPFLQAFLELKYVFVGSIKEDVPHPTNRKKQEHSAVTGVCHCPLLPMQCGIYGEDSLYDCEINLETIRSICAFVSFGWISSNVLFAGLLDGFGCDLDVWDYHHYEHNCQHCKEICASYPLDQLMLHMHKLCLSQQKRLDIIAKRDGGMIVLSRHGFAELVSELSLGHLGEDSRDEFFTKIFDLIERGLNTRKIPHDKLLLALFRDRKNPECALSVQERRLYKEEFDLLVDLGFALRVEDVTFINWDVQSASFAALSSRSHLYDADDSLDGLEEVSQPSNQKRVEDGSMLVFPTEVWSMMMEYLTYSDVLPMSAVSSFFLQDVFPLIKTLFVDKKKYLDPAHANRFPGAQSVFILCINQYRIVDDVTSIQTAPFLQSFPKLKYFFVGNIKKYEKHPSERKQEHSPVTEVCHCPLNPIRYDVGGSDDAHYEQHRGRKLILSIGAAMGSGRLSSNVAFGGLFGNFCCEQCWDDDNGRRCELCETICKEYPVDLLTTRLSKNVCIPHDARFQIVSHRPGGLEALKEAGLLPLLTGVTDSPEWSGEYVYRVPTNAIRRLVAMGLKPQDVNRKDMLRAMFAYGDNEELEDAEDRWMDLDTFHQLRELGFPLRWEDISEELWD